VSRAKNKIASVKFSPREYKLVQAAAKKKGVSLSAFVMEIAKRESAKVLCRCSECGRERAA
jgi:uncharacterized protein (DUF1778 family)